MKALILTLMLVIPNLVMSAPISASQMIENFSVDVMKVVRESNKNNYKKNIRALITDKYSENVDFKRMTLVAAGGKSFMKNTSKKQKSALINEYSRFITGFMSTVIFENSNHSVDVLPFEGNDTKKTAKVHLETKNPVTGEKNKFSFAVNSIDGSWKIHDLIVLDTSQVKSNAKEYAPIIKDNGYNGLISDLKELNIKLEN